MNLNLRSLCLATVAAALLAVAPFAHADVISATVYTNIPDPGNSADPANMSSTLPSATFTVGASGIDFQSQVTGYTPATFLNNPTFSNEVNGFNPNGTADNIEIVITGTLFMNAGNNSFEVAHDDGVVLNVAGFGNVVNQPGPTGEVTTPFNVVNPGAAGTFNFTLNYAECCGAPADLIFQVNDAPITSTPEPSSFCLFGSGLLAAAGMVRRRFVL
jgi:PEP-CTERM motif